ncbi:MAG: hypothetical protein K1060chlam5_01031 [Candidatus Anoxychlamydiales bacterium]|nr:hypothetical protein [Candidatus Anoxychlamydiales bacterium]
MTLTTIGPFPGLKINRELRRHMISDLTRGRQKFAILNAPAYAYETAKTISFLIRGLLDRANQERKLSFSANPKDLSLINKTFNSTNCDSQSLIDLTFHIIQNREYPYPIKSMDYKIYSSRITKLCIELSNNWSID